MGFVEQHQAGTLPPLRLSARTVLIEESVRGDSELRKVVVFP